MNYEKIVTLYDTAEHAEAAKRSLESAGFAPSEISLINSKTLGVAGDKLSEPGLWHRLFGRDIQGVRSNRLRPFGRGRRCRPDNSRAGSGSVQGHEHPQRSPGRRSVETRRTGGLDHSAARRRSLRSLPRYVNDSRHATTTPVTAAAGGRRRGARARRGTNQRRQAPGSRGNYSNSPFRHRNTGGNSGDLA